MELKKDYKQTEVGVIPEDWEPKKLGVIVEVATGNTPPTKDQSNYGSDYFFVSPADLGKGKYITDTEKKLSKKGFEISRKFPTNSILFTCIGSTIGKAGIAPKELTSNQQINAIFPDDSFCTDYLFYALTLLSPRIKSLAGEQAVPIINKSEFEETLIPLPPTKAEQEAIAEALSDADALIESLEQLITKKLNIKQAAMQELLTGKKRLPGFSGKWATKKLGEMLAYEQPTKYLVKSTEYYDNSEIAVLTANKSFILGFTDETDVVFENVPVVIFDDFTTASKFVDFPFKVKSSALKILKLKDENYNLHFLFGKMQLIRFPLGVHKRYWISEYQHIEIEIPSLDEQTAIAEVLSDMDAETEALEQKRDKYKDIKQGMMQELLTGKTRLI